MLTTLIAGLLLGQAPNGNLDFGQGSLAGWEGNGFVHRPAEGAFPAGASSDDKATGATTGTIRRVVTIPANARLLTCVACADGPGDFFPDHRLAVALVLAGETTPLPRMMKSNSGEWIASPRIESPWLGKPRTYGWNVAAHGEKRAQIVLIDQDDRPGNHLFAGGFQFSLGTAVAASSPAPQPAKVVRPIEPDFAALMLALQTTHKLAPMSKFDSKRFTAISNAPSEFAKDRVRNCEVFYDLFLKHFQQKGFSVVAPKDRMMIAVFDSHAGFDAYFGQKMPAGIAGMYDTPSNRLVLYDLADNRALVADRDAAMKKLAAAPDKNRKIETLERKIDDWTKGVNLSTTMHEAAHLISFNCGLLNRRADVPAWLAEGLATYCESTDQGDWTSLGSPNPMRINDLHRARGQFLSIAELIRDDRWLQTHRVLLGYAQSWALFHMLMNDRPKELRRYLTTIYDHRTPESRLADFQHVFGDTAAVQIRYAAYLRDVMAKQPPTIPR